MSHLFADGFALLIGVGHCTDENLSLPGTVNDARALEKVLGDPEQCGYPPEQVSVIVNDAVGVTSASKEGILNGLHWLEECTTSTSTVIVYFSGHAKRVIVTEPAYAESFYLIPGKCDLNNMASTTISARELAEALDAIHVQKLLVILDCCHAGGFDRTKGSGPPLSDDFMKFADPDQIYQELKAGYGRAILLSSGKDQSSWLMKDRQSSVFTHHLIEALCGNASTASEKFVTVARIFDYVSDNVPATVKAYYGDTKEQIPQISLRGERFVVALLPARKDTMPNTPDTSQPLDTFNRLYNILRSCTKLDLREISRAVHVDPNRLNDNSPADMANSLVEQVESQGLLSELETVLRQRMPKRFS